MTKLIAIAILIPMLAQAATQTAATTSRADVLTAYTACADGDTLAIPAGTSSWATGITISKRIRIWGNGTNSTQLQPSSSGNFIFRIMTNRVMIGNIRFEGNAKDTTNEGLVQVGNTGSTIACDNVYTLSDWRVCSNRFTNIGTNDLVGGLTAWPAIMASGYVYGLIDHNEFFNCYGECLDLGADGTGNNTSSPLSLARSLSYGGYTNGTIYIEDNVWNYTLAVGSGDYGAENAFDGNSGSRWVIRRNTFNVASNTKVQALISNHEFCAPRSCDGASQGDVGSLMMEIYLNTVNNLGSSPFGVDQFVHQRGGQALIYSNTITGNDTTATAIVRLSNFRSYHRLACGAQNARNIADVAHEVDGAFVPEGLDAAKTTLNGGINASVTTITLASSSGFNAAGLANGFSIRIGTEQIDYTAVSGNQLTTCVRGANGTTAASHSTGANVDYLKFGVCKEQITNTYIWANLTVGAAAKNTAEIGGDFDAPDYSFYDIVSFASRPANWQYREGSSFSYTAVTLPFPLDASGFPSLTGGVVSPPTNLRIAGRAVFSGRITLW